MQLNYAGKIAAFQNALIPYRNARNDYIINGNREIYLAITNNVLTVCKKIWLTLNYKDREKWKSIITEMEQVVAQSQKRQNQIEFLVTRRQIQIAVSQEMLKKIETLHQQGFMINHHILRKLQNQINIHGKFIVKKGEQINKFQLPLLNYITSFVLMSVNQTHAKKMLNTDLDIKSYQERMKLNLKKADYWTLTYVSMKLANIIEDIMLLSNGEQTIKLIQIIQSIIKENLRKTSKPYNDEVYILWNDCVKMMKTAKQFSQVKASVQDDIKKRFKNFFIFTKEQNIPKFARDIIQND